MIYGPRRVGKTTLLKNFLDTTPYKYRFETGDNLRVQKLIGSSDLEQLVEYAKGYDLIVIDEAQNIPNVGIGLKILVDHVPDIRIIATGSSSFDLSNKIGEPLVGRQKILRLYPISVHELSFDTNPYDLRELLTELLVYGLYPEVLTSKSRVEKAEYLTELVNSYLLRDLLTIENFKSPRILMDLLKALAFQLGHEVSYNELSNMLKVDVKTIQRYLDLLEKSFILYSLGGYSKNLRSELVTKRKYYFLDVGIRNALIGAFNAFENRNDIGQLWENFLMLERLKVQAYQPFFANNYFWRTYSQKEIDFIEERDGELFAYEFKWKDKKYKVPAEWSKNYPDASFKIINPDNYLPFTTFEKP